MPAPAGLDVPLSRATRNLVSPTMTSATSTPTRTANGSLARIGMSTFRRGWRARRRLPCPPGRGLWRESPDALWQKGAGGLGGLRTRSFPLTVCEKCSPPASMIPVEPRRRDPERMAEALGCHTHRASHLR
jgi:hypothetical protein